MTNKQQMYMVFHKKSSVNYPSNNITGDQEFFPRDFVEDMGREEFLNYLQREYVDTGLWKSFGKIWLV